MYVVDETGVLNVEAEPFIVCILTLPEELCDGPGSFNVEENDEELQLDFGGLTPKGT